MITPDAPLDSHLTGDLLVRALDDELSGTEALLVQSHLAACDKCREQYQGFHHVSLRLESALAVSAAPNSPRDRELLVQQLDLRESRPRPTTSRQVIRGFGWGMAIAATLALGVLFIPGHLHPNNPGASPVTGAQSAFEVDGESFVPLPYSNPYLPMSTSHVVEMQVSVSSLADAGILFEPIGSQASRPNDSVLADVLLGIDGQPLGVHVLAMQ
jgi:predicted anti-sigma-YlaC factor YlaD